MGGRTQGEGYRTEPAGAVRAAEGLGARGLARPRGRGVARELQPSPFYMTLTMYAKFGANSNN